MKSILHRLHTATARLLNWCFGPTLTFGERFIQYYVVILTLHIVYDLLWERKSLQDGLLLSLAGNAVLALLYTAFVALFDHFFFKLFSANLATRKKSGPEMKD